jgi:diadenosine tetraphosphate (Ap4A) HIT family hydrolase
MALQKEDTGGKPNVGDCELCAQTGEVSLWRDELCRVVLVSDPEYAGYCRVIWNSHVREMTDLSAQQREHCMNVVFAVERTLRNSLRPHKINLASFGNLAPHVHWHVIPRFEDDAHFPLSIWGERQRAVRQNSMRDDARFRADITSRLLRCLEPDQKISRE